MERAKAGVATTARDQLPSTSRYELLVRIASGGMATVYVGRLSGAVGFWRLVAVKRAHAHLLEDSMFAQMLVAEARLASKIHHPNVVAVQDVEELEGELLLVMDYVEGASLAALIVQSEEAKTPVPLRVALRIIIDACAGLHAAHELTDDNGTPLGLVHRDVSPHNVLVGADGVARIADFGIAKVSHQGVSGMGTATGALKGKVAYMAPEYIESGKVDARSDVFALGIVAWEVITRRRLFRGQTDIETLRLVLAANAPAPSSVAPWVSNAIDAVILKALAKSPDQRFSSANAFGEALETAARAEALLATAKEVGTFVRTLVGPILDTRRQLIRDKTPGEISKQPSGTNELTGSIQVVVDGEVPTLTLPAQPVPDTAPASAPTSAPSSRSGGPTPTRQSRPSGEREREVTSFGSVSSSRTQEVADGVIAKPRKNWIAPVILFLLAAGSVYAIGFGIVRYREAARRDAIEQGMSSASAITIASAVTSVPTMSSSAPSSASIVPSMSADALHSALPSAVPPPTFSGHHPFIAPVPVVSTGRSHPPPQPSHSADVAPPNPYGSGSPSPGSQKP